eukprot:scaffold397_cov403-Prasinococcus_capsulatus_cf.AAC.7
MSCRARASGPSSNSFLSSDLRPGTFVRVNRLAKGRHSYLRRSAMRCVSLSSTHSGLTSCNPGRRPSILPSRTPSDPWPVGATPHASTPMNEALISCITPVLACPASQLRFHCRCRSRRQGSFASILCNSASRVFVSKGSHLDQDVLTSTS